MNFLSGLTLVFILAKLFGAIDWSWLIVLSPTIVPFVILSALFFYLDKH